MGLQLLERERKLFEKEREFQPVLDGYDYVLERQLKPEARSDIVGLFKEPGIRPTSMIDISDGLSSELMHLCTSSNTGCRIYSEKIPIHPETRRVAGEFGIDPLIAALNGGEDYELLFTFPVDQYDTITKLGEIKVIGHMVQAANGLQMITPQGEAITLEAQGWNSLG
jgi:thiamine-monophosphate kinase